MQRGLISVVLISVRNSRNKRYTPRDTHAVDVVATLSKFSGISNLSSCIHSLIRGVALQSSNCSTPKTPTGRSMTSGGPFDAGVGLVVRHTM